jgi:hypothetical protein
MTKFHYGNELGFNTRAIYVGNDIDSETGVIRRTGRYQQSHQ